MGVTGVKTCALRIYWLRPSKRSASVFLPPAASKPYSLSTFTHGSCRRSALTASRCRVRFFSFASSSLRAVIHSSRDTTLGLSIVLLLVTSLLMTLSPLFDSLLFCQPQHSTSRWCRREICSPPTPPTRPSRMHPQPSSPKLPSMLDTYQSPLAYRPAAFPARTAASARFCRLACICPQPFCTFSRC